MELKLQKVFGEESVALTDKQMETLNDIAIAKQFVGPDGKVKTKVVFFDKKTKEPISFTDYGSPYIQAKPGDFLTVKNLRFCEKQSKNGFPYLVAYQLEG